MQMGEIHMNEEQKKRAAELLTAWRATAYALHGDAMADLLQEMVDAPEPEPVARVTGYYAGYLSIATVDGRVLPADTALYAAPPAPSVPDEQLQAAFDRGLKAGNEQGIAQQIEIHKLHDLLAAPTPAEAPADVARDAERWRLLPAFLEEFEIPYLRLEDAIDAAMSKKGGA